MANKRLTAADFEGKKHFMVYLTSYGQWAFTADEEAAKKEAAKALKVYPTQNIILYEAKAFAEENIPPLKWADPV